MLKLRPLLAIVCVGFVCVSAAMAQESPSVITDLTGLSTQQQLYFLFGERLLKYIGEVYSSIKSGGGLKRILMNIWFSENIPHVIATEYKAELNTSPPSPPPASP